MKNTGKRFLALALTVVMLLSAVPLSVFAASFPAPNAAALNFGFEQGSSTPSAWTYTGNGKLSLSANSYVGNYAAQLAGTYGTAGNILKSSDFALTAGADYQLSFWIKTDMAYSAYVEASVEQKDDNGNTVKTTYFEWMNRIYEDTDWRLVRLYFTGAEGATNAAVRFQVMGSATTVLIDDVSVVQTTPIPNFDFEEVDERGQVDSWYLSVARNSANVFKQDTTRYHSGNASLYTEINSTASERRLLSSKLLTLQDTEDRIYEVSAWISSKNSDVTLLRFELLYYDANGAQIGAMEGTQVTLNAGPTASEWKQIITRKTIPDEVVYVRPVFVFAGGIAEIWIDDVFIDLVEDGTDIVAVHNDFHAVDQSGNIAGWELETTGTASFEQKTDATEGTYGHLSVTAGNGAMKYTTNVFGTRHQYTMAVRYKSDLITDVVLKFYDFQKDEYVEKRIESVLPATEGAWRDGTVSFTAPSATFCEILFGPQGAGTLDMSQLVIYQTSDAVAPVPVPVSVKAVSGAYEQVKDLVFDFDVTLNLETTITEEFPIRMNLYAKNADTVFAMVTAKLMDHTDMTAWPVGEDFTVSMQVILPDYIVDGAYSLQLPTERFTVTDESIYDNRFLHFSAVNDTVAGPLETAVKEQNGEVVYTVNGDVRSKFWFETTYREMAGMKTIYQSGMETVVAFDGDFSRLWLYSGFNYAEFDRQINTMLAAAPEADFIVTLGLYAPAWWLAAHPDEQVYLSDTSGNLTPYAAGGVSFGSSLWLEESNAMIAEILAHMKEQPYYSHVAGIRLSSGRTAEMFPFVEDGKVTDYSPAARSFFQGWAEQKYGTLDNLNAAWGTELTSFDEITLPTYAEYVADGGWGCLLNPATQQKVIDFRLVLDEMTATCIESWCATIKAATDRKLIVGAYYGYNFNGASGTGTSHTAMQRILTNDDIDFFCAPLGYNERQLGQSAFSQAVMDTIRVNGKLLVTEQDHRSVLTGQFAGASWTDRDNSVGNTHTMDETLLQEKRDFAYNLINGNAQYLMDMYDGGTHDPMFAKPVGGWWDDPQVYEFTNVAAEEYYISAGMSKSFDNDVALIFTDDYAGYYRGASSNAIVVAQSMYKQQRKHLGEIGAGYDVYSLSTLADGKMPQHKINVFLTPFMLTAEQRTAIDTYCKNNGQINVFLYMPGIGDEEGYDLANMTELTGFTFGLENAAIAGQVKITNGDHAVTSGLLGETFGVSVAASVKYYEQSLFVDDSEAVVLGTQPDTGKVGFAVKDMGDWTSVYTMAPTLTAAIYRNLLNMAGAHIYSDNPADVIYANGAYVSLHSAAAGEKTITLPANYAVYDVYEQEMVSPNTNTITFYNAANDTHLFRLMPVNTYSFLSRVDAGGGSLSFEGLEQVTAGATRTLTVTPDAGYVVKSVTVNGVEQTLTGNTLTVSGISENTTVVAAFTPEASTREWTYTFDSGLLTNGSFESDLGGWTYNANYATRVEDGADDSRYAIRVDGSTAAHSANSERVPVDANSYYRFDMAFKGDAAAISNVRALLYDANGNQICYSQASFIHRVPTAGSAPDAWTSYTSYFKTTPNTAYVSLSLYTEKGVMYYDSISLTRHEHFDNDGDNWCDVTNMYHLIENAVGGNAISKYTTCKYAFVDNPSLFDGRFDLDTKLVGVKAFQNAVWSQIEDADGSRQSGSLKLTAGDTGAAYYDRAVAVTENTVYTVSLQTKFENGGNLRLQIWQGSAASGTSMTAVLQSADTSAEATAWTQRVLNFKTGAGVTDVYIRLTSTDTAGSCYVDNWQVRLHEHMATDAESGDWTCAESYYDLAAVSGTVSSANVTACEEIAEDLIYNGHFSVIPHGNTIYGVGSTYGSNLLSVTTHWQANGGTINYSADDRRDYTNSGSIKLIKTGTTSADFMTRPTYYVNTAAGQLYTLSFWYKTDAADVTLKPRLVAYNSDMTSSPGVELKGVSGATDGWQYYETTVQIDNAVYAGNTRVQFYLRSAAANETPQELYVDDIMLVPIAAHEHADAETDHDYLCDHVTDYRLTNATWQSAVACGYDMTPPAFTGATMTLGAEFRLNLSVDVYNVDPETVTVVLDDLPAYAMQKETTLALSDTPDARGYYTVSIKVAAAHMHKDFTATLYVDGVPAATSPMPSISYSVKEYATGIIEGDYTAEEKATATAMLNYGAWAQKYFGVDEDDLANAGLADADRLDVGETEEFKNKIKGIPEVGTGTNESMEDETVIIMPDGSIFVPPTLYPIDAYKATTENKLSSFIGYTLLMQDGIGMRMYFGSADVTATVNGEAVELVKDAQSDRYYLELILPADELTADYTVTATEGGNTMTVKGLSVLTPARTVINNSKTSANYKNVCVALILYAEAVYGLAN